MERLRRAIDVETLGEFLHVTLDVSRERNNARVTLHTKDRTFMVTGKIVARLREAGEKLGRASL